MTRLAQLFSAALALGAALAQGQQSVLSKEEVGRLNDESLFWGPYKSNLYFGVRPKSPKGFWSSLMWGGVNSYERTPHVFRYTCEQGEDIHGYGWDEYDARTGGVQTIHDDGNQVDLTTSFVKFPGGDHGGSWAVRIKGDLQPGAPADTKTMLFYYLNEEEGKLAPTSMGSDGGFGGDIEFKGSSDVLGDYKVVITKGKGNHPTSNDKILAHRDGEKTVIHSLHPEEDVAWQAKQIVFGRLKEAIEPFGEKIDANNPPPVWQVYRMENLPGPGKIQIIQKTFEGPFEFDVIFSSGSAGKELTSEDVTRQIKATSKAFEERFAKTFKLQKPFTSEKFQKFAKSMFSNLLGGIGYFHGEQVIDRSYADEYDETDERFWEDAAEARARKRQKLEGPYELFTAVPSRPFFPRGFLWDEGFHLIPIADWDTDLTLEIIKSWFKTIDDEGWIPREQILGPEARSKVPEEFQVQYPHYANPPTLFLAIEDFMERLQQANGTPNEAKDAHDIHTAHLDNAKLGEQYLHEIYPLLRRQYDWFRKTQRGDIKTYDREAYSTKEAYRWRGRTETHVLTSGLDDYPRPQPPTPGELHVDLMSWVGLMTKSLLNIASALGNEEDVAELKRNLDAIEHNVNDLHWSEKEGCYCDASIDEFEEHALVCHKGYISIFPFLVGLMKPEDPKVGRILDLIGDEDHLWSPHGIRSLSKQDPNYGTGENYWRSPVWMPINYLVVSSLRNLAVQEGPHKAKARELFSRLRENLVNTVYKSWKETGFAWEQYNPDTGAGQRTQHFTGWTSLVVKLMAMDDLSEDHVRDEL
ncbi:unnamed protein product [Clonostachys rosea f. rosea IK726]|uniref:Mannosyl-oligosaccharide glucosidase n=2 Tax=Bionectria ochroleuca TaxID=29856 RepID=A0A0B7KPI6_BIOOC|nr:unnamed protein product [Clonostachys rosea f. rosea IK726]